MLIVAGVTMTAMTLAAGTRPDVRRMGLEPVAAEAGRRWPPGEGGGGGQWSVGRTPRGRSCHRSASESQSRKAD